MNSPIRVLPPDVVNQIAAGEVVTRPASVVKELLDNAVDAGATEIDIEIRGGGRTWIRVKDNGSGMSRESLALAVQPHATSKIRSASDLMAVKSLGFRGEALPSIISVARVEMISCESADVGGHKLTGEGRDVGSPAPAQAAPGTAVTVKDLFWNIPARRKFLKSEISESRAVSDIVIERVLASPNIHFTYRRDGREVFTLPANEPLIERIRLLFGDDVADACIAVNRSSQTQNIRGFATDPSVVRKTRSSFFIYVNGRRIQDRGIQHAVVTAYRETLHEGFPAVFLFIEMDPSLVDVNVHPSKAEVRFADARIVQRMVLDALSDALHRRPAAVAQQSFDARPSSPDVRASAPDTRPPSLDLGSAPESSEPLAPAATLLPHDPTRARFRVFGQIYSTFILMEEIETGEFYFLDQHVASERVMLARLKERVFAARPDSQALLVPLILELGLKDAILFKRVIPSLQKLGFEVEPFGPKAVWIVRAVPSVLGRRAADRKIFLNFVEELAAFDTTRRSEEELFDDVLGHFACKMAIKAGDRLMPEDQEKLVDDLLKVDRFRVCPHGRPSMIKITRLELEQRFLRK